VIISDLTAVLLTAMATPSSAAKTLQVDIAPPHGLDADHRFAVVRLQQDVICNSVLRTLLVLLLEGKEGAGGRVRVHADPDPETWS
jgi:mRNA-degrading endonuclease toxin of MazEF toxin-antitoxin module